MKNYGMLLIAFLFVISCKKKDEFTPNPVPEPAPLTDFLYLPVKDAEWRIHLRNFVFEHEPGPDTAYHEYHTIRCTNTDTFLAGVKYYRYTYQTDQVYTQKPYEHKRSYHGFMFLREDTAKKVIYIYGGGDMVVADFSVDEVGKEANVSSLWPTSYVTGENGIVVNGQKVKSWEVAYGTEKNKKFFYKAYGIGTQMGILPPYFLGYCEPASLDFTYKGKTNHFDFELHQ